MWIANNVKIFQITLNFSSSKLKLDASLTGCRQLHLIKINVGGFTKPNEKQYEISYTQIHEMRTMIAIITI